MNEFAAPLPVIGGDYTLRYLTSDNGPAIQRLCERCPDYFDVITGLPPGPAEAESLFVALPEGSGYEDKALIGVVTPAGALIGVMDAVRDAPEPGEWWLGAMLLDPAHRCRGLGTRLYHALEPWLGALGTRSIRLSVVEPNRRAGLLAAARLRRDRTPAAAPLWGTRERYSATAPPTGRLK